MAQAFAFTPRTAAALLTIAHPAATPLEVRAQVGRVVDPDRTILDAAELGDALRSLLGADHWDRCITGAQGLQPLTLVATVTELLRRADGAPALDQLQNLDTLNREPASGRPRSIRALVDDLLGVAPVWSATSAGRAQ